MHWIRNHHRHWQVCYWLGSFAAGRSGCDSQSRYMYRIQSNTLMMLNGCYFSKLRFCVTVTFTATIVSVLPRSEFVALQLMSELFSNDTHDNIHAKDSKISSLVRMEGIFTGIYNEARNIAMLATLVCQPSLQPLSSK